MTVEPSPPQESAPSSSPGRPDYAPLPEGAFRKWLALFAWNLPGLLLVVCAVSSGKIETGLVGDLPTSHRDWFSMVFLTASLIGFPTAIRIGEVYGRRRSIELVCAVGVLGQLVITAAPSFGVALTGHAIAGLYTALGPVCLFALGDAFPGRRNFALCVLAVIVMSGATAMLTNAVMPSLLEAVGWRGTTGVLAALLVLAAVLMRTVPRYPATGARFSEVGLGNQVLVGAGPALIIVGLVKGLSWGWSSAFVLSALGAGVLCVLAAVFRGIRAKAAAPVSVQAA